MNIETVIEEKLMLAFEPLHLDVVNESGHGRLPLTTQPLIKVIVISEQFEGKRVIHRHRAINHILSQELIENISALAVHAYTEHEWSKFYVNDISLSSHCLTTRKIA